MGASDRVMRIPVLLVAGRLGMAVLCGIWRGRADSHQFFFDSIYHRRSWASHSGRGRSCAHTTDASGQIRDALFCERAAWSKNWKARTHSMVKLVHAQQRVIACRGASGCAMGVWCVRVVGAFLVLVRGRVAGGMVANHLDFHICFLEIWRHNALQDRGTHGVAMIRATRVQHRQAVTGELSHAVFPSSCAVFSP